MKLKFGRTRAVSGTENMSPAGFLAFSLILVVFAVDLRPAEAGFFGFLNNKARALRESPNAVPRLGWLVGSSSGDAYSQECWKSAAEMAVAGSGIELAFVGGAPAASGPTSPPSTAKTTVGADDESETWRKFNVLYKSGVRTFIGLDDHDAGKLLKRLASASSSDNPSPSSRVEYEDVTFLSPFATSDSVRNHPSVVALSPSSYQTAGSVLSKTGEWSYSEILPVLGGPGKKPAGDDLRELRGVLGFRLLEPVIAAESGNVQHDIEEIKTQLFLRFWENPNANIYFDSKPHFVSFLRSLNSTYGESLASRILFSPNAVFFDDDLSSSSTERAAYVTATHMQLHSAAFLGGEDYTSPVRRRLFSTLNDDGRRLGRPCSVAAALVYDAALVAKAAVRMKTSPPSVGVVEEAIQGATGTMTLRMSVAGRREPATQDVGNGPSGERSSFAVRASLVRPGEKDIFARFFAADPARYVGSGVRIAQHSPWILDGMLETNRRPAGVRPSEAKLDKKSCATDDKVAFSPMEHRRDIRNRRLDDAPSSANSSSSVAPPPAYSSQSQVHVVARSTLETHVRGAVDVGLCRGADNDVEFRVRDPLHFARAVFRFRISEMPTTEKFGRGEASDAYPVLLPHVPETTVVPTAAGYSMAVRCDDVVLEIACPGMDSALGDCLHEIRILDFYNGKTRTSTTSRRSRSKREVSEQLRDRIFLHALRKQRQLNVMRKQKMRRRSLLGSSNSNKFQRRVDLHKQASVYERMGRQPGYISRLIGYSAANLMACMGKVAGCIVCIGYRDAIDGNGQACGIACTSIGGTCSIAAGRIMAQYNVDTSVVCTELHAQGRLPLAAYLVDAGFGARLARADPDALRGYWLLARPVVAVMRASRGFSDVVEAAVRPWLEEMTRREGHCPAAVGVGTEDTCRGTSDFHSSSSSSYYRQYLGRFSMEYGLRLCSAFGKLCSFVDRSVGTVWETVAHFPRMFF